MNRNSDTQNLPTPISVPGRVELRSSIDTDTLAILAAHELREPVQAIRSFLAVLLDGRTGQLTDLQRDFLLSANHAAQRAGRLIDDLHLVLTDGQMSDFQRRVMDLNTSVVHCCRELSQVAHDRTIALSWEPRDDVERTIHGDPDRVDQILLNVLENAIQYSPEDSTVEVGACDGPAGYWRLIIENETGGEHTQDPDEWLVPFSRGGLIGGRGLGLGLTVVQMLVQAHHGRFRILKDADRVRAVIDFPTYSAAEG